MLYTKPRTRKSAIELIRRAARELHAVDFETTSLDPADGRARLISIAGPKVNAVIDFDVCGDLGGLARYFERGQWVVFNSKFEGRWFAAAGAGSIRLHDVGHLRRAQMGGANFSLKVMASWDLDEDMDKDQQLSDWNGKLSRAQLDYAWGDASVTWRLWEKWFKRSTPQTRRGYAVINDMWPGVVEMEDAGMRISKPKHRKLIRRWELRRSTAATAMRRLVDEEEIANLRSDAQINDFLVPLLADRILSAWPKTEKTGRLSMKVRDIRPMAQVLPYPLSRFLAAVQLHRKADKLITSFGETLLTKAKMDSGRVHARFNICAARTGRFSCSSPNLQQVPHDPIIRSSFIAPLGRRIIKMDYSLIEMRVLALLAGDEQLLADCIEARPRDVHTAVAMFMYRKDNPNDIAPWQRTSAKKVGFGVVYGSGAAGLALNLRMSMDEGQRLLDRWEARYPKAFAFRHEQQRLARQTGYLAMISGRQVWVGKKASLPVCANYPVQGGALDVMAGAVSWFKDMMDGGRDGGTIGTSAMILGTVHDEMIAEAHKDDADEVAQTMHRAMELGWLDMFPGTSIERLVDGGTGPSWGDIS